MALSERIQELREHMERHHAETWPVLSRLTSDNMGVLVYDGEGGSWTVKDILGHLADAERGVLGQAQRLVNGKQTVPPDFDLASWNRSAVRKASDVSMDELLGRIATAHRASLDFLASLDDAQLDLVGRHSSGEMFSTEGFLRRIVNHRAEHVADIQAALQR